MTQPTIDTLLALAAKRFGRDAHTLNATDDFFDRLGINSFQAMELLTDIEEEFEIEIPDYELQGVTTFSALAALIEERL
ncbi:MAG: acyl carrier protein [Polyangiales bacterium]